MVVRTANAKITPTANATDSLAERALEQSVTKQQQHTHTGRKEVCDKNQYPHPDNEKVSEMSIRKFNLI